MSSGSIWIWLRQWGSTECERSTVMTELHIYHQVRDIPLESFPVSPSVQMLLTVLHGCSNGCSRFPVSAGIRSRDRGFASCFGTAPVLRKICFSSLAVNWLHCPGDGGWISMGQSPCPRRQSGIALQKRRGSIGPGSPPCPVAPPKRCGRPASAFPVQRAVLYRHWCSCSRRWIGTMDRSDGPGFQ